jgi:hypothetical protein
MGVQKIKKLFQQARRSKVRTVGERVERAKETTYPQAGTQKLPPYFPLVILF